MCSLALQTRIRFQQEENEKYFSFEVKFSSIFIKVFFFYFRLKIFFKSCEKFRNIMLFANYINFDHQTFDCYIFCFNFFFQFHPLESDLI